MLGLFFNYFRFFPTTVQFEKNNHEQWSIYVGKIWCRDSNSRPLDHQSLLIKTFYFIRFPFVTSVLLCLSFYPHSFFSIVSMNTPVASIALCICQYISMETTVYLYGNNSISLWKRQYISMETTVYLYVFGRVSLWLSQYLSKYLPVYLYENMSMSIWFFCVYWSLRLISIKCDQMLKYKVAQIFQNLPQK